MGGKHSKRRIRKAGSDLAAGSLSAADRQEALRIVGYWRAAHLEPLRKALTMLEGICGGDEDAILVSRLKRIDTIVNKLKRPDYNFALTTLRDIAGCRLIVRGEDDVRRIAEAIWATGQCHDIKDYIREPKESGYRGMHLICRYDSGSYGYENLSVEIQVRSRTQHDWATAVEIYDMVAGSDLKFGGGSPDQRRYFQLASKIMNQKLGDDLARRGELDELKDLDKRLRVFSTLREAVDSMYVVYNADYGISRSNSCLISVDVGVQQINVEVFPAGEETEAAEKYTELESRGEEGLVYLLARAGSFEDLRRAYPNYYSDISEFVDWLQDCVMDCLK